jgi:hypothetical protein
VPKIREKAKKLTKVDQKNGKKLDRIRFFDGRGRKEKKTTKF